MTSLRVKLLERLRYLLPGQRGVFTEEEVNESLRDLADFVEAPPAEELASDLREFLEELEGRLK
ncbi:MAG: hypothetical protein BZY88_19550 [SAR202 cluster bacterium Io17-Chloro-G9]|nr:MAG: hypothetical protein BZY88_19550 [SAR202 cluster bacterium Io17-Chloro-G9]